MFNKIFKKLILFKHTQAQQIVDKIENPEHRTAIVSNQSRIAQDIRAIEIYCQIYHERDTMYGCTFLTFEATQKIYRENHAEVYCRIPEETESLLETPFTVITYIGKHTNDKIQCEQQYQPVYIILYRHQQPGNIRQCCRKQKPDTIHDTTVQDI